MKLGEVPNKIVTCYGGSIAYGTNTPESDVDIRGIFCADEKSIRTPFHPIREVTLDDVEDGKMYELTNFMKLYCDMNPNILEMLWVDEADVIETSEVYKLLRSYAPQLLSKKCAFTFSGYAVSQLKRIKGHNKWINNPQPKEPPRHHQFLKMVQNFTGDKVMPREFNLDNLKGFGIVHYGGNIFGSVDEGGSAPICAKGDFNISCKQNSEVAPSPPRFLFKYLPDEYKLAKEKHTNYWKWKDNRNPARAALEEQYGFDGKDASHSVRLLRMCEEILTEGVVRVKRPDAEELLAIRNGAWSYEDMIKWAEDKANYIQKVLYKKSDLRKNIDLDLAGNVLMMAQSSIWK